MAQPVRRQPVAWVLEDFGAKRNVILPDLQIIFIEQDGTGIGTQLDPTNVENALDISDPNDVIISLTTTGDITPTEPILLLDGQQWGSFAGAPDITVTIMGQGMVTIPNLTGSGTAVINGNGTDIFTLANNSRLFDLITNGGQTAVVGMGVDNLLLENLSLNTPAVGGLLLDGVNTATVNGLSVTGGPTAISLQNNTAGTLTFGTTTITDPTTTGVDIGTTTPNSVPITFATLNMGVATGATGLDVAGQTGNVTVSGGTMNHTAGGISTRIDMGTAVHNYTALTINNDGATVPPIQLTNTTGGSIAFGTVGITSLAAPSSVLATSNAANITFADLSAAGTTGPVTVNGGAGTFGVTTGTLALTADGALFITDKAIAGGGLNLTSLASTNAPTNAINLQNVSGGFIDIDAVAITTPTGDAILLNLGTPSLSINNPTVPNAAVIDGGSANAFTVTNCTPGLDYRGRLTNGGPANFILDADTVTGGFIILLGFETSALDRFLAQTGGDGVRVNNSSATIIFNNASITNATGDAVSMTDQSGGLIAISRVDLITPIGSGVNLVRASAVTTVLETILVNGPGAHGLDLLDHRGTNVSCPTNTFVNVPGSAIRLEHLDAGLLRGNIVSNTESGNAANTNATYHFIEGVGAGTLGLGVGSGTLLQNNTGVRTAAGSGILFDNNGVIQVNGGTTAQVDLDNPGMATGSVNNGPNPLSP